VNRPNLSLRRPLAVLGAAFVGLAAAVAVAAPASAHHPIVTGTAECDTATGDWKVTWTVANSETDLEGKITAVELTPAGTEIDGIAVDAVLPKSGDGVLTGKQTVPGDSGATEATLKVSGYWNRDGKDVRSDAGGSVHFQGTCAAPSSKPAATFVSKCDGSVVVTLVNAEDATKDATFVVTGEGGFTAEKTVAPGEDDTVTVPAANAGKITVTEKGGQEPVATGKWTEPEGCAKPGEPTGEVISTCDELVFVVANPEDGVSITITFTPNTGEPKTVTVEPGETETVAFPAQEGLTVTPTAEGLETETIAWEEPEDCDNGGGGGGDDGGPILPVTGAAAGGMAAGAALLLAVGAGLFLVARRRRIRFTA
jgi:hypothetical protein